MPVPDQLRGEIGQIAARAAAAGRPLGPAPMVKVAGRGGHSSRVVMGPPGIDRRPRVLLGLDLLDLAPVERAWTFAHELSHVLRRQEGTRLQDTRGPLLVAVLLAASSVAALLYAGYLAVSRGDPDVGLFLALAMLGAAGMALLLLTLQRREETETDATAAAVFGEVLTPGGVDRIRRDEGALSRWVPTLLRSHPHPAARRRAGLSNFARRPAGRG